MELRGRTVLVTGADGFIGSHLVEALLAEGAEVRAFVWYNPFNAWGCLDLLPRSVLAGVEVVPGDIRDPGDVEAAAHGTSAIFHLAALVGIPFSYRSPAAYVATNVGGTLHVLEAARKLDIERTVVASSSEVYGTARYVPMDEAHPHQAQSPYAATKIAADRLAESYHRSFGLPIVVVRPFNTYGPRQSARAVIPTIAAQLLAGRGEVRLGSLEPRRDFTYVRDTARAFIAAARCDGAIGQDLNAASGRDISIGELAGLLAAKIDPAARVCSDAQRMRPRGSEVERLLGSSAKLRALAGWAPEWDLERGLDETVAWLREPANLRRDRAEVYNL